MRDRNVHSALHLLLVRDVGVHELCPLAQLGGKRFAPLGVEIGHDDVRAALVQRARGGLAEPGRSPDDERACTVDSHGAQP
jgi:hypothetical protein